MIGIDRLMERRGVLAVGQFSHDGRVIRAVGDLSREEMESVALTCALHEKNSWKAATDLREGTSLEWGNLHGWVLWAGNLALCVSGDTGVFVEASKADFNQLLVDIFGPPAGEHPKIITSAPASPGARESSSPSQEEQEEREAPMEPKEIETEDYDLSSTDTHRPARPMKFFKDKDGCGWLCDKDVDPDGDLAAQGCWRCDEVTFPVGR
jgi:roadblock/LC7 domain-containing protein